MVLNESIDVLICIPWFRKLNDFKNLNNQLISVNHNFLVAINDRIHYHLENLKPLRL